MGFMIQTVVNLPLADYLKMHTFHQRILVDADEVNKCEVDGCTLEFRLATWAWEDS